MASRPTARCRNSACIICRPGVICLAEQPSTYFDPGYAYATCPSELEIKDSRLLGDRGLKGVVGLHARTCLSKHTVLGIYRGTEELVTQEELLERNNTYIYQLDDFTPALWKVRIIDAYDSGRSNFLRFVNTRKREHCNVEPKVHRRINSDGTFHPSAEDVYMITIKQIKSGEELFVFYSQAYNDQLWYQNATSSAWMYRDELNDIPYEVKLGREAVTDERNTIGETGTFPCAGWFFSIYIYINILV